MGASAGTARYAAGGQDVAEDAHRKERLTLLKRGHREHTREHALVVSVENAANASKGSNRKDPRVFDQRSGPRGAHQGLASMQSSIVDGGCISTGHHRVRFTRTAAARMVEFMHKFSKTSQTVNEAAVWKIWTPSRRQHTTRSAGMLALILPIGFPSSWFTRQPVYVAFCR